MKDKTTAKMDALFSEYIRKRAVQRAGGCERCGSQKYDIEKDNGSVFPSWKQLQCSHFHGRNSKMVRWDPDNACGLCGACHMYLEHHPIEHVKFYMELIGEPAFTLLEIRSRQVGRPDINAIWLWLKQELK